MFSWFKKKKVVENPKGPALACVHHGICSKQMCPMWVTLTKTHIENDKVVPNMEGRCAFAWMPEMMIEMRNDVCRAMEDKQKHQMVD